MPSNSSRTQLQSINEGAASGSASASGSLGQHRKHKPSNVSPSQLNAGNLHQFPKDMMRIHNRDSGIARHPLFCCVVRCFLEGGGTADVKWKDIFSETLKDSYDTCDGDGDGDGEESIHSIMEKFSDFFDMEDSKWEEIKNSINECAVMQNMHENAFSGRLSSILSLFCIQNKLPFLFTHQETVSQSTRKSDAADIGVSFISKDKLELIGLNEVKKTMKTDEFSHPKWQLCGYQSEARLLPNFDCNSCISFGLVIDQTCVNLYGFCWKACPDKDALLEHSLLCEANINYSEDLQWLLKLYFFCLHTVTIDKIKCYDSFDNFCPLQMKEKKNNGLEIERIQQKVFKCKPTTGHAFVVKIYDYANYVSASSVRQPNVNISNILVDKNNPSERKVFDVLKAWSSTNRKYYKLEILEMPFVEGQHTPTSVQHIRHLCSALGKLHAKNKCHHGDVLRQNIIFGTNAEGEFTKLLDFDFSHMSRYPKNWNTSFPERHPDALSSQAVHAVHDIYAAVAILCLHFKFKDGDQKISEEFFKNGKEPTANYHPHLIEKWSKISSKAFESWLVSNGDALEQKTNMMLK